MNAIFPAPPPIAVAVGGGVNVDVGIDVSVGGMTVWVGIRLGVATMPGVSVKVVFRPEEHPARSTNRIAI
jgi:hypothetical protein